MTEFQFIFDFKKSTQFYQEDVYDCIARVSFGANCLTDKECTQGLACDIQPAGAQTKTCSLLYGSVCSTYADCANNIDCLSSGKCGCDVRSSFL